jgi:hypothetical protein
LMDEMKDQDDFCTQLDCLNSSRARLNTHISQENLRCVIKRETTDGIKAHLSDKTTLGEFLDKLREHKQSFYHKLMHEARDYFIGNRDSPFSEQMIQFFQTHEHEVMKAGQQIKGLVFAFIVLTDILKQSVIQEGHESSHMYFSESTDELGKLTDQTKEALLQLIERHPKTPISAKICASSIPESRRHWIEYNEEIDHGKGDLLKEVMNYLFEFDLKQMQAVHPKLAEEIRRLLRKHAVKAVALDPQSLYDYFPPSEKSRSVGAKQKYFDFCNELIKHAMEHFSSSSLLLFRAYERSPSSFSVFQLLVISRYLVKHAGQFEFAL